MYCSNGSMSIMKKCNMVSHVWQIFFLLKLINEKRISGCCCLSTKLLELYIHNFFAHSPSKFTSIMMVNLKKTVIISEDCLPFFFSLSLSSPLSFIPHGMLIRNFVGTNVVVVLAPLLDQVEWQTELVIAGVTVVVLNSLWAHPSLDLSLRDCHLNKPELKVRL